MFQQSLLFLAFAILFQKGKGDAYDIFVVEMFPTRLTCRPKPELMNQIDILFRHLRRMSSKIKVAHSPVWFNNAETYLMLRLLR